MSEDLKKALAAIPTSLRSPLVSEFEKILSEYRAGHWESVGLKAGKLCEIIYSILHGHLSGAYPTAPSKPANMVDACKALEQFPSTFPRSARIQIPRMLVAVYELRNNRAIGHVGGDVDPNHMDAELFLRTSKWMISELVRLFDNKDTSAARDLIESITERSIPVVWEDSGFKKVLNAKMVTKDKVLVLCYATQEGVSAKTLCDWLSYSNLSRLRSTVLADLDKAALLRHDTKSDLVRITPAGVRHVEASALLEMS